MSQWRLLLVSHRDVDKKKINLVSSPPIKNIGARLDH